MKPKAILSLLGAAGAVVCLAFNAYALYRVGWGWGDDAKTMNETGDFLGGVTAPLLNFLTFIAVLYTTAMQAEELRISNETLSATQGELAQSRETAQRQFSHMECESKKSEVSRVLELLDSEAQFYLKARVGTNASIEDNLEGMVMFMKNSQNRILDRETEKLLYNLRMLFNALQGIGKNLSYYSDLSEDSPVVEYYKLRYDRYAIAFSHENLISMKHMGVFRE